MTPHGRRRRGGRAILGGVAVATLASGYLVDWNRTHLFNPAWPPHAKFHDAWTVLLGTALGAGALNALRRDNVGMAAYLPALFWTTQAGSFAFPNTGGLEREFPERVPRIAGVRLNEGVASAALLGLTLLGYGMARYRRP